MRHSPFYNIWNGECRSYIQQGFQRKSWVSIDSLTNESSKSRACQHSVHPTGGSLRVFGQFSWLRVDSVKMAWSRPAHQPVTQAVRCYIQSQVQIQTEVLRWLKIYGLTKIFCSYGFGFQIVGLVSFSRSFQFSVCRWSKFWLIVAYDYLAGLSVKSLWRRFFFWRCPFLAV